MQFHIPGLPHIKTHKEACGCAYSMKVWKLCKMLMQRGHTVYFYGQEGSDPPCTENVTVVPESLVKEVYNYDWKKEYFKFDVNDKVHQMFYANTIEAIKKRIKPRDFLLCAWGWGHQPIAGALGESVIAVESGIGYSATFAKFKVFESNAWMSWVYGQDKIENGSWYDCVIPNFFEPEDYQFQEKKQDYFLYLGRLIKRKGVELAVDLTKRIGAKLILAGQGELKSENEGIFLEGDHIEHVGYVGVERRKELLANAKALIAPTYYIEPFGGVAVEAMMSGTPVIASDWGVFPETVLHGHTGYRCRTMEQFEWAARNIGTISPSACRQWAENNFSCDRIVLMYEEYFQQLQNLYGQGWYENNPGRTELNWLRKEFPVSDNTPDNTPKKVRGRKNGKISS